jgi:hypothetical protein
MSSVGVTCGEVELGCDGDALGTGTAAERERERAIEVSLLGMRVCVVVVCLHGGWQGEGLPGETGAVCSDCVEQHAGFFAGVGCSLLLLVCFLLVDHFQRKSHCPVPHTLRV